MKYFIAGIIFLGLVSCTQDKIAYVNIQALFNEFEYKKELEKELNSIRNNRKYILDSLETNLKIISKRYNIDKTNKDLVIEFNVTKEIYLEKKSLIEDEEIAMVKQFDEKIIKQLNSYVKEYGKSNSYKFILGATSDGNIMYSDTTSDISKQVIIYINNKYKGVK
ncbi:MAG: hypothetical protein K0R26_1988 [Bacteroidota bacterium]|jgi:outer membrane protein|nr:hypothetical protein [Bacteroidota bacterium]